MYALPHKQQNNVGTSRPDYPRGTYFKSILGEFCIDLAAFEGYKPAHFRTFPRQHLMTCSIYVYIGAESSLNVIGACVNGKTQHLEARLDNPTGVASNIQ